MSRYHLFLTSRPAADRATLDQASARCPSTLDHAALIRTVEGRGALEEWVLVARTDRRGDVRRMQRELGRVGCALALEDEGGSLASDLAALARELVDPEARAAARKRRAELPRESSWFEEHLRPILALTALGVVAATVAVVAMALVGGRLDAREAASREAELPGLERAELDRLSPVATGDAGSEREADAEATAGDPRRARDAIAGGRAGAELPDIPYRERVARGEDRLSRLAADHPVAAAILAGTLGFASAAGLYLALAGLPFSHDRTTRLVVEAVPMAGLAVACAALLLVGPSFLRIDGGRVDASLRADAAASRVDGGGRVGSFATLVERLPSSPVAPQVPFATLLWHLRYRAPEAPLGPSPRADGSFADLIGALGEVSRCAREHGTFARLRCALAAREAEREEMARRLAPPSSLTPLPPSGDERWALALADARLAIEHSAESEGISHDVPLARATRAYLAGLGVGSLAAAVLAAARRRKGAALALLALAVLGGAADARAADSHADALAERFLACYAAEGAQIGDADRELLEATAVELTALLDRADGSVDCAPGSEGEPACIEELEGLGCDELATRLGDSLGVTVTDAPVLPWAAEYATTVSARVLECQALELDAAPSAEDVAAVESWRTQLAQLLSAIELGGHCPVDASRLPECTASIRASSCAGVLEVLAATVEAGSAPPEGDSALPTEEEIEATLAADAPEPSDAELDAMIDAAANAASPLPLFDGPCAAMLGCGTDR